MHSVPTRRAYFAYRTAGFWLSLAPLTDDEWIRAIDTELDRERGGKTSAEYNQDMLATRTNEILRESIPSSVKTEVWRRDHARCSACGSQRKLEFDHIIPVSLGGSNTARNIQLLCETCNRKKGASLE